MNTKTTLKFKDAWLPHRVITIELPNDILSFLLYDDKVRYILNLEDYIDTIAPKYDDFRYAELSVINDEYNLREVYGDDPDIQYAAFVSSS